MPPSTEWRERVAPDEDERFARHAAALAALQRRTSEKLGPGRALHRKQHLGLSARLEVLGDLPEAARHGLFAKPATYDARVRLSNGTGGAQADRRPDVRGFALRVEGVEGPGALGGPTTAQCFVMINASEFAIPTVDEFVDIALAAAKSPLALLGVLVKRHGLLRGLGEAKRLGAGMSRPFPGFALAPMHCAAPIACGPYAAKVRLVPDGTAATPAADPNDWSRDVRQRLASGDLRWHLQLQFFVDEERTPIEKPPVPWSESASPWVPVARLVVPKQDPSSDAGRALAAEIEAARFDPWAALADHRPLGEIMRARKAAYFASQEARGAK